MDVIDLTQSSPDDCERIKRMMAYVGSKWAPMALAHLAERPHRFSELLRALTGISQRMLTLTLREMERDGLVTRKVTPTVPPRVDYSITDLGTELAGTIASFGRWSLAQGPRIDAAQRAFEAREPS